MIDARNDRSVDDPLQVAVAVQNPRSTVELATFPARSNRTLASIRLIAIGILSLVFAGLPSSVPGMLLPKYGEGGVVAAQEGSLSTPTIDESTTCSVAPRQISDFAGFEDAPPGYYIQAAEAIGTPFIRPVPDLSGVPAEPSIVNSVTRAVRELVACGNSGGLLRLTALMTDDYVLRSFGGLPSEAFNALATPQPIPEDRQPKLLSVTDVLLLPDGSFAATMTTDQSTSLLILVKRGDRYLLDDNFELAVS